MGRRVVVLNAFANLFARLVGAAVGFLLPAAIISSYGSEANGLVSSLKQVITHLMLLEGGVGAASVAALYGPLRSTDVSLTSGILSATRKFFRRAAFVYTACLACATVGFTIWGPDVPGVKNSAWLLLAIGLAGSWELFSVGSQRVICLADNRAYCVTFVEAVLTGASGALAVVLVGRSIELALVFGLMTLIMATKYFALSWSSKRRFPWVDWRAAPKYAAISSRWSALVHQVASAAIFSSPVIILAATTNLVEVSVFSVYYLVMTTVTSFVGVFANGLAHSFGVSLSLDRVETLRAFRSYEFGVYPIIMVGFGLAAVLFVPFVALYSTNFGDGDYVRPNLAAGFIAVGLLSSLRVPANLIVTAAGHFRETRTRALIEMGLSVSLMLALSTTLGIWAFVVAGVVSFGYRSIDFVLYANRRVLGSRARASFRLMGRNAIGVLVGIVTVCVSPRPILDSYPKILAYSICVGFVLGCCTLVINAILDRDRLAEFLRSFRIFGGA